MTIEEFADRFQVTQSQGIQPPKRGLSVDQIRSIADGPSPTPCQGDGDNVPAADRRNETIRELRCVISDLNKMAKEEREQSDDRIRQLEAEVLKLKCDLDWVADESKEYREKWERQCRLSMERLANERADANRARGALEAQNERLSAENARLRESLQTHNNAGIDVTMQLHALREAVAGLADECRSAKSLAAEIIEKQDGSRQAAFAAVLGVVTSAISKMFANRLDAILKGTADEPETV